MIEELISTRDKIEKLESAIKTLKQSEEKIIEKIVENSFGAKTIKTELATISIENKIYASIKGGLHDTAERKALAELIRQTQAEGETMIVERIDFISDAKLSQWCKEFPDTASFAREKGFINIEVKKKITLRRK
jgi:septal ring factor EnvC (AmiA/AmiB activator)